MTWQRLITGDTETIELEKARRLFEKALQGNKAESGAVQMSIKGNEYINAVKNGNEQGALDMLKKAATDKGYLSNSDYQGTSSFNGIAPSNNGYFETKQNRIEAWKSEEFEGDQTLGDYLEDGIDINNLVFVLGEKNYQWVDTKRKEAIKNIRETAKNKKQHNYNVSFRSEQYKKKVSLETEIGLRRVALMPKKMQIFTGGAMITK